MKKSDSKNNKESKSIRIIVILLIFVFVVYLVVRGFIIYFGYRPETDDFIRFQDTITLEKNRTCDYTFGEFSVCLPDSFSLIQAEDDVIGYTDSQNRYVLAGDVEGDFDSDILSVDNKVDVSEFKQKYQFSSTIDVLHYFEEHQNDKFSLFSKISDVRDYYIMWNLVNSLLPEGDLYYIEGDYYGYLVKQKNNYCFYFYDDNGNKYSINFGNSGLEDDYFNDDNIFSYLGSVRVED